MVLAGVGDRLALGLVGVVDPAPVAGDGQRLFRVVRIGADLDQQGGYEAARQTGLSILATLRAELGSLDRVRRVVKTLGLVNCTPDFESQPAVINGFSELMAEVFGPDRQVSVSRELSKLYGETLRGTLESVAEHFKKHAPRGEFVLVVRGADS